MFGRVYNGNLGRTRYYWLYLADKMQKYIPKVWEISRSLRWSRCGITEVWQKIRFTEEGLPLFPNLSAITWNFVKNSASTDQCPCI